MLDAFVLVVDDNPETVNMLAKALELDGIRVRTASSVLRALEAMHDGSPRPSLIITDLMMPQTTGWDFLKHLRSETATLTMPVIVITGAEPGESEALADLVIQKPVDPVQLTETVRTMLIAHSKAS
jgi:DNA-binding response OmpR family regulator